METRKKNFAVMDDQEQRSAPFLGNNAVNLHDDTLPGHSRFKFDLQPESMEELGSIMKMIIDKLSALKANRSVTACALKLFPVPPHGAEKMAVLVITMNGNTYATESCSSRWDNAFLNALDIICRQALI
jgi:hypothetical protein